MSSFEELSLASPLPQPKLAIETVDLTFHYTSSLSLGTTPIGSFLKRKTIPVLNGISLSAAEGQVYALLGPSGCGKTTLLKCILGRLNASSGSLAIFGGTPSAAHIPGPGVGFMPQESALFPDFTIFETIQYFGRLYGLSPDDIKSQVSSIIELLHLPAKNKKISTLSGGQVRRVSLACALIHRPRLLVLDEPTVGVDPLLRSRIWDHLERLGEEVGVTVLITTHYIEEASRAGRIGLLRDGALLVEGAPQSLLAEHGLLRLEDLFLKLCEQKDAAKNELSVAQVQISTPFIQTQVKAIAKKDGPDFSLNRTVTLFKKNCTRFRRNLAQTLFFAFLPCILVILVNLGLGYWPHHIPVAIVNDETAEPRLSENFLSNLNSLSIRQVPKETLGKALDAWERGEVCAIFHLWSNFSQGINERLDMLADVDESSILSSNIHAYLDFTSLVTSLTLFHESIFAYRNLLEEYLVSLGSNPQALSLPIDIFGHIVYGSREMLPYAQNTLPGALMINAFTISTLWSALSFKSLQIDGLLERSLIAGVGTSEILLAHLASQLLALVFQNGILFAVVIPLLGPTSEGPLWVAGLLASTQNVSGIVLGTALACILPNMIALSGLIMALVFPCFILSGIVWPLQAMFPILLTIAKLLPVTIPAEAQRYIFNRGWGLERVSIRESFYWIAAWTLLFGLLILFVKKNI